MQGTRDDRKLGRRGQHLDRTVRKPYHFLGAGFEGNRGHGPVARIAKPQRAELLEQIAHGALRAEMTAAAREGAAERDRGALRV